MKTFSITTLGCRVNHYESEQLAALLRARGLHQAPRRLADLRIVHTCSVTTQAASKSRQSVRRSTRLQVLSADPGQPCLSEAPDTVAAVRGIANDLWDGSGEPSEGHRRRVVVTGCWATSNPNQAAAIAGVDAVLGHQVDVATELTRLLDQWQITKDSGPRAANHVKGKLEDHENPRDAIHNSVRPQGVGTTTLPQLDRRQSSHQRAFLKIQDGCDAHCTYCIIPQLRPALWSKPIDEAVSEAQRLVDAGHVELVLTGIFLGAYGQPTALRRRQEVSTGRPLGELVEALCTRVTGLRRVRLSSLESGDLSDELLRVLKDHPQVVPHFHLPLQSGSDLLLRRMNRQYGRDDFLRMVERLNQAFDRPALTTDIIVGFPGETDREFERTVEVVNRAGFIHIHAFSFSPRPGTAAARWSKDFIHGPVVNQRINHLSELAARHSRRFREQFIGSEVEILIERPSGEEADMQPMSGFQHGRCERYFAVHVEGAGLAPGSAVKVRIDNVSNGRTLGHLV